MLLYFTLLGAQRFVRRGAARDRQEQRQPVRGQVHALQRPADEGATHERAGRDGDDRPHQRRTDRRRIRGQEATRHRHGNVSERKTSRPPVLV